MSWLLGVAMRLSSSFLDAMSLSLMVIGCKTVTIRVVRVDLTVVSRAGCVSRNSKGYNIVIGSFLSGHSYGQ